MVWVVLAFIGDELALFLICRPLNQYWAVPPVNRESLTYPLRTDTDCILQHNAQPMSITKLSMQFSTSPQTS